MDIDWECCVICQQPTKESLRCPKNAHTFSASVYNTFLNNVLEFNKVNYLPVDIKFEIDNTTVDTLMNNNAKWHQSCHLKFRKAKERRSRLLTAETADKEHEDRCGALKRTQKSDTSDFCVICNEGGGTLHSFCTLEADTNLRLIAGDLQDFGLLSRISGGDLIAIEAKYHMRCLTNSRNRQRSEQRKTKTATTWEAQEDGRINESRAFIELIEYITDSVENDTFLRPFRTS